MSILPTVNGIEAYKLSITFSLGDPEDISYTVYGPQAASLLAGRQPPNKGVFPITFGAGVVARMLSNGAQLVYDSPGYVTETGKSIGIALQQSAIIHRFTAQQISVGDAFNGGKNGIHTTATNTIAGSTIPDQQGIAFTSMGVTGQASALQFQFIVDSSVQGQTLDIDINEDNVLHATQVICTRMGTFVNPEHTQFVIDSGAQTVTIGARGTSNIAFGGDDAPVLRMTTAQAQTTDMCASVSIRGGDTSHGMPATGKITDMVATTQAAIVAIYSSTNTGGVYYWRADNTFVPMSQAMGVNGLWFDSETNILYAATDAGVYKRSADVGDSGLFERMGFMALTCPKVQNVAGDVYALATFTTGDCHVLQFESGFATLQNLGFDFWKSLVSHPDMIDFAVMGNFIFTVRSNNNGVIEVRDALHALDPIQLPRGTVLGLDPISINGQQTNLVVIRTDLGSAGLWALFPGQEASPVQIATSGNLSSNAGPVLINSIRANTDIQLFSCSTGQSASYMLAATSAGVFNCSDLTGLNWQPTDGQSATGDFVCSFAAAGGKSARGTKVFAAGDSSFYVSGNGGVNWIDALSQPLDAGPYFSSKYGSPPPDVDNLTVTVNLGNGSYVLRRVWDGISQYAYELINPSSTAPAAQHRSAEITEFSAPALLSPLRSSTLLVEGMARFLAYTADPQEIVEVESVAFDAGSSLLDLRPGWGASVSGTPTDYIVMPGGVPFQLGSYSGQYYCISVTFTYDRDSDPGAITVRARLGKLLLQDRSDPEKLLADLAFAASRQVLYRSKAAR